MEEEDFTKRHHVILKKDDILYFLHVPKTAGLTLIYILNNFFDYSSILIEHSWDQLLPKLPKDFSKYRFVRGHFGYGFHRQFSKKPIYITMLRDPVEHTISSLEMVLRLSKLRSQYSISEEMNFTQMVESRLVRNLQTLFLAVDVNMLERIKSIDLKNYEEFTLGHLREYVQPNISDKELIEIAKKHLSEFAFVGLTERFDESLLLLCYTFDWIPIRSRIKINVTKKRLRQKDLPKKSIDLIREKINLDAELYNYGKQVFEERYLEMVHELKEKYADVRLAKVPQTNTVYELLKKYYIERHGRMKFMKEVFQFNLRKINFVVRYGWKTRIKPQIFR